VGQPHFAQSKQRNSYHFRSLVKNVNKDESEFVCLWRLSAPGSGGVEESGR
jgi:hypothetical protein